MSALHWICAVTLALVCSLSAQPVKQRAVAQKEFSVAFKGLKDFIEKNDVCPDDTRLYSPTEVNEDCLSSALNCTIDELQVLRFECNVTTNANFTIINLGLRREKWNITSNLTGNCTCELNKKTDVKQFVNNMENLVQRLFARG